MKKQQGTRTTEVNRNVRRGGGDSDVEQMALNNVNPTQWREVFNRLDDNHDGLIEMKELRAKVTNSNLNQELNENDIQQLYELADKNRDRRLSYGEFNNLMNSPYAPQSLKNRVVNAGRQYIKAVIPAREPLGDATDSFTEYPEDYINEFNCNPPPIFIILISVVELGVFIYYGVTMEGSVTSSGPVPYYSPLIYDPYRRYQAWRFLSYMLIHSGYMHITFNLLMQILLGIPLEMVHKWWRVAIVYFAGVIAGSLGTSISDPSVYLAGASAGDYAIITAHLATVILNWKEMVLPWLQVVFFVIIIGSDVGVAVYNRYATGIADQRTGYSAHLAGAIAGLLIGIGVLKNLKQRPWEKKLWWGCIILYVTLMLIAVIWNAAFTDYFLPSKYN